MLIKNRMVLNYFWDSTFFHYQIEFKPDLTWEQCDELNDEERLTTIYLPTEENVWFSVRDEWDREYYSVAVKGGIDLDGYLFFDIIVNKEEGERWAREQNGREREIQNVLERTDNYILPRVYVAGSKHFTVYCEQRSVEPPHKKKKELENSTIR